MSWVAEADGVCWDCGGPIVPGQSVDRSEEPNAEPWLHVECPAPMTSAGEAA